MIKDLWTQLKEDTLPIVLYGTTDVAEKVIALLAENGRQVSAVFASDDFVREKVFCGFPVKKLGDIESVFEDFIILLCFGTHLPDVLGKIKAISEKHSLYAPDFPVTGEGLFNADYYEKNKQQYDKVRNLLADDQSKKVFDNIISYRLSGKLDYLYSCESSDENNWKLALPTENLLDLGAYTGDTAALFESINPDYRHILAVEPGSRNFRKLSEYAQGKDRIRCFNLGIGDKNEIVNFPKGSGRGSSTKKYEPVQFTNVDKLIEGIMQDNPQCDLTEGKLLVKMDLEGWESKAIDGAKETIKKLNPSMYIAAYHRLSDMIDIPLQILSINPDYDVYLRHSPCIPSWENNYIFVPRK